MNVVIGGTAIRIDTGSPDFDAVLRTQYAGFIEREPKQPIELTVDLTPPEATDPDADIDVRREGARWIMNRGDFHASYDPAARKGAVRQSASRQSLDSVIRIVHSLTLAAESGFLLHAASAIRADRAFVFCGQSGAGKTTISGLAPADVHLLTDEVSYVRRVSGKWLAFGTPFAGEMARPGENRSAEIQALFMLRHGVDNRVRPMDPGAAARSILRNVLFFAADAQLVRRLFDTVCEFAEAAGVFELSFQPDARVWDLIR